jgi:predicted 3-demethylubiquinone-9 3-methyltransferase (glyoxalase superfamily)
VQSPALRLRLFGELRASAQREASTEVFEITCSKYPITKGEFDMQKITPYLWFDSQAEEAMNFYTSIFKNSKVLNVSRYPEGAPGPAGGVMIATFELEGQEFTALNGGPQFNFTEAISFLVNCKTQKEVDELWQKLSAGGEEGPCGWLKDKFGVSWQIIPTALGEMLSDPNPAKAQRVMEAMLKMKKIEIPVLQQAYDAV